MRRLKNILGIVSKRFDPCQDWILPVGTFCGTFCRDSCTQLVPVHLRRRCPDASLVPAPHDTLFGVLTWLADPDEVSYKLDFFDQKEQDSSVLSENRSGGKKSTKG